MSRVIEKLPRKAGCTLVEFPIDLVGKASDVKDIFDYASVIPKLKKLMGEGLALRQAELANGTNPPTPELCQKAASLYNELNAFIDSLPLIAQEGIFLGQVIFSTDTAPPCRTKPVQLPGTFFCITGPGGSCGQ
jgi:hypothetical protein